MKKDNLVYAAFAVFVLALLFRGKLQSVLKKAGLAAQGASPLPPAAVPPQGQPAGQPGAQQQLYDADSGIGAQAIQNRMRQIFNSAARRQSTIQASGAPGSLYTAMKYPEDMRAAMATVFGSAAAVPIVPPSFEPAYIDRLDTWQSLPGFERTTRGSGIEKAFQIWRPALEFSDLGVNFWPSQLPTLIEAGAFKSSGPADRDRSERYDAFTEDMKILGQNIIRASRDYEEFLKAEAIQDLRATGWAFVGYDAPPAQTAQP